MAAWSANCPAIGLIDSSVIYHVAHYHSSVKQTKHLTIPGVPPHSLVRQPKVWRSLRIATSFPCEGILGTSQWLGL